MKKHLLIAAVITTMIGLSACTGGTKVEEKPSTENETTITDSAEEETEAVTEAIADSEEMTEELVDSEEEGLPTEIVNSTGKTLEDVTLKLSDGGIVGLGNIEDGKSVEKNISVDQKEAKLEFKINGDETRLSLDDGFQGFKVVVKTDDADGFNVSYEGIDE